MISVTQAVVLFMLGTKEPGAAQTLATEGFQLVRRIRTLDFPAEIPSQTVSQGSASWVTRQVRSPGARSKVPLNKGHGERSTSSVVAADSVDGKPE